MQLRVPKRWQVRLQTLPLFSDLIVPDPYCSCKVNTRTAIQKASRRGEDAELHDASKPPFTPTDDGIKWNSRWALYRVLTAMQGT